MSETVERNNRFYKQPDGKVLTENEQLKEWLVIANESNDYFREENVRLINKEKELLREIHNKINEIERLNKALLDIKEILKKQSISLDWEPWSTYQVSGQKLFDITVILDKVEE